jgi:hypothetical protein
MLKGRLPTLREALLGEGVLTQDEFYVKQMINVALGQGLMKVLRDRHVEVGEDEIFDLIPADVHSQIEQLARAAVEKLKV